MAHFRYDKMLAKLELIYILISYVLNELKFIYPDLFLF